MTSPIQYNKLTVVLQDGSAVTIECYNRTIVLFSSESEEIKRVHRVFCVLEREMKDVYKEIV